MESPLIDQIYVHGDALKSFLLAVVVPNEEVAQQWCKVHGKDGLTFDQICKDQVFIEEIHKDIIRIGAKNKVRRVLPKKAKSLTLFDLDAKLRNSVRSYFEH